MTKDKETKVPASTKDLAPAEIARMKKLGNQYTSFLSGNKTPHESVATAIKIAETSNIHKFSEHDDAKGFYMYDKDLTQFALVLFGTQPAQRGITILGAHLDSPALNIRSTSPVIEAPEGVILAAKPYGGIWPHQWLDSQVLIKGLVPGKTPVTFDGMLSDRGIHIARAKISGKKVSDAFPHELLKVVTGFATKDDFLAYLKYDCLAEEDFFRGTWWVVPKAAPALLGENVIAGYGHDDRICFFAQLAAALTTPERKYPLVVYGCSREEIGSTGINGAKGAFIETVIDNLLWSCGIIPTQITGAMKRQVYAQSMMISSDVDIAYTSYDEKYQNKTMAAKLGDGIAMVKANGRTYQSGGNCASDTFTSKLLDIFHENQVAVQLSEIPSKLENGGGGTIAMYFAERGIPVIDAGPPVGNMHGKTPIAHVGDLYQTYKAYRALIKRER